MDPRYIYALKKIALKGGMNRFVSITSEELGDMIRTSQQTGSKRILEMVKDELIVREVGIRGQKVKITPSGAKMLSAEYSEYRSIFEGQRQMAIRGIAVDGMGEGGYYICQDGYISQFERILGFKPYKGTFNVKVMKDDLDVLGEIQHRPGLKVDGFEMDGRSFGGVTVHPARISGTQCAMVVPDRSHYLDVIEIVSEEHLRRKLSLRTKDPVEVVFDC